VFYRTAIRPAMLYGAKCWPTKRRHMGIVHWSFWIFSSLNIMTCSPPARSRKKKRRHIQQLSVAEMRMLHWICGHTRLDRVRNDDIRDRLGVAPIEKLIQHRLRWFGHIHRRPPEAPVHRGIIRRDNNVKRVRDRPNLT
jgi:FPC/CPF motif-containing protein YcgG